MAKSIRIRRAVRSIVAAGLLMGFALACTAVASAADPIVTVGSTGSPGGGSTPTGTVNSDGQTDLCLDQQHSGANPGASSTGGMVLLTDKSCAAGSGSGAGTTSGSGSGGGGAGGGGSSSTTTAATGSTQTGSAQTSSSNRTATVTRRSAGSTNTSNTNASTSTTRASVAAANARGLRILRVQYKFLNVKAHKRLRVTVTLRDRQKHPIRSAIVSIGRLVGAKSTLPRLHAGFSNKKGQAVFVVTLTKPMFGKRLLLRIGARTPSTHVSRVGSIVVPKQRAPRKAVL